MRTRWLLVVAVMMVALSTSFIAEAVEDVVEIWPMIQAPVGTEQTYLVRQRAEIGILERAGLFVLVPMDVPGAAADMAHLMTLRVLEPHPEGWTRVHATVYRLNPETLQPVAEAPSVGVYVLTHEDVLEEETGESSEDTPLTMFLWGHVPEGDAYAPMAPGEVRRIRIDTQLLNAIMQEQFMPGVVAEVARPLMQFVGWETLGETDVRVAHVRQTTTVTVEATVDGELKVSGSAPISTDVRLVPGAFPISVETSYDATFVMELLPNVVPGLTGTMRYGMHVTMAAETVDGYRLPEIVEMELGDAVTASLGPDVWDLGDGSPAAVYAFRGSEGERVRITLQSRDFDAYLLLADDEWDVFAVDDDSAGGTDALLTAVLPATGRYFVIVNTYHGEASGRYTLRLESLGRAIDEDVLLDRLGEAVATLEQALTERDWNGALNALEQALATTRSHLPLAVESVTLVSERPNGFGDYTARPHNVYRPGEAVYIYLEPRNFHTRETDGRSELHLTVDAILVDAAGEVVASFPDVVVWNRFSTQPLQDVYLAVPLLLGEAVPGDYVWRLTVRDAVSGQAATVEVPVVVMIPGKART